VSGDPILFLVSRGLLDHKPRMKAAIWEYLWFIDRVTKDEPDGSGKFNGLVLGGQPISAAIIARELHEHLNTAKANIKALEAGGYIVRRRRPDNRCSYVVTNSKKWFWNRVGSQASTGTENCVSGTTTGTENCARPVQKPVRASTETCTSNKERHDSDTTVRTISSNPAGFDQTLNDIFRYYLEQTNRNPKTYEFTPLRKQKGASRLKECFRKTGNDLGRASKLMTLAVDGLVSSNWHMGRDQKTDGKRYCDWENHLFNSYEQMEHWWNVPVAPVKPNGHAIEVRP
jgi:hypothetical protein